MKKNIFIYSILQFCPMTESLQYKFLFAQHITRIERINFALFANYEYKSTIFSLAAKAVLILRKLIKF